MPDLLQTLIARKQQEVQDLLKRDYMPQQAGEAQPGALRAEAALRKAYPQDMRGVKVRDMSWSNPLAFSNTLAYTPMVLPKGEEQPDPDDVDPFTIRINPASSILEGQGQLNRILAHELQHVRQNRTGIPEKRLEQFYLPYNLRPDEKEAAAAADNLGIQHPEIESSYNTPKDIMMVLRELQHFYKPTGQP